MGKSKEKARDKARGKLEVAKLPKKKCCVSSKKCNRCPLRMLKEGTLPAGYTVKKRKLVRIDATVTTGEVGMAGTKVGKVGKKGKKADKAA